MWGWRWRLRRRHQLRRHVLVVGVPPIRKEELYAWPTKLRKDVCTVQRMSCWSQGEPEAEMVFRSSQCAEPQDAVRVQSSAQPRAALCCRMQQSEDARRNPVVQDATTARAERAAQKAGRCPRGTDNTAIVPNPPTAKAVQRRQHGNGGVNCEIVFPHSARSDLVLVWTKGGCGGMHITSPQSCMHACRQKGASVTTRACRKTCLCIVQPVWSPRRVRR